MSEAQDFLQRSERKAGDEPHRKTILKAIASYDAQVISRKENQFIDWSSARELAGKIREATLDRLPDLLEQFEKNITAQGAMVHWAVDAAEARTIISNIVKSRAASTANKKITAVKSKSMVTEEIDLNEALESEGVEVFETDLGELIVQLAGEKPYHIVTPAMHKSRADVARLFQEKLGIPYNDDPEQLTAAARAYLRQRFIAADVGITGANFLIADAGAVVVCENEGNARLCMACPPVHIVVAGIERVLPRLQDLELFLPLLATSGTGQQITTYNSIVRGPKIPGESDGPHEMHVVLLDNGRSHLYQDAEFREALRCIRCGACLNACPVYRTVGGHAYNTTYQGPIGSVITPHLRDMSKWGHLSAASSLCGACTSVCPVNIPLHHLLLKNRIRAYERRDVSLFWRAALKGWAMLFRSRSRLNLARSIFVALQGVVRTFLPGRLRTRTPELSKKSFAEIWRKREQ